MKASIFALMKHTYGRNFWMLCISVFLFMTSFNLLLPELNDFITDLGGSDQKGLIITLFTISAAISRPFSGKLSDTIGRRRVMIIGVCIAMAVCLIYPFCETVYFFLFLRFLHGFSAGFLPTGATALVADILPSNQRGLGMGIWGTFISLGFGGGQALATPIRETFGMDGLFISASIIALISGILLIKVKESLVDVEKFELKHLKVGWKDVFEPSVLPAAMVMFLTATCSGIILVLNPDISGYIGINNKGWFFGIYSVSTILVRLFTSRLSDVIGRRKTLVIGVCILIVSLFQIVFAQGLVSYTLAAVVFGFATGMSSPTLFAWTADLSHPQRRGVGTGTIFIALEVGIMFGSFSTIYLYDNTWNSIPLVFTFGIVVAFLALFYLLWHLRRRQSVT
jgi:MFS family permease